MHEPKAIEIPPPVWRERILPSLLLINAREFPLKFRIGHGEYPSEQIEAVRVYEASCGSIERIAGPDLKPKHAAVVEEKGSALALTEQKSTYMEVEP